MLLSTEKNFLFVHVPKTAGQSLTAALSPWCVTPRRTAWRRLLSRLPAPETPEKAYLRAHDKADWIRRKLPAACHEGAFKFATVRNPYDLAVSYFHYLREHRGSRRHRDALGWEFSDFVGYLGRKNRILTMDQTSWIADRSGRLIIDEVLRFGTLAEDFDRLAGNLDLGGVSLQRINGSRRGDYRDYYDGSTRAAVERIFARDFERFGYRF